MTSMRSTASLLALLMLSGCGATLPTPPPKPNLPALPASASAACARPVTKLGDDLGVAALKWKATYVCEHGKRVAIISFYGDLKKRLGGK
jgi:hypothetical protein